MQNIYVCGDALLTQRKNRDDEKGSPSPTNTHGVDRTRPKCVLLLRELVLVRVWKIWLKSCRLQALSAALKRLLELPTLMVLVKGCCFCCCCWDCYLLLFSWWWWWWWSWSCQILFFVAVNFKGRKLRGVYPTFAEEDSFKCICVCVCLWESWMVLL